MKKPGTKEKLNYLKQVRRIAKLQGHGHRFYHQDLPTDQPNQKKVANH